MIKTKYGTEIEIIEELKPWRCNGNERRQVKTLDYALTGTRKNHHLIEDLTEDEPGEIEKAIRESRNK